MLFQRYYRDKACWMGTAPKTVLVALFGFVCLMFPVKHSAQTGLSLALASAQAEGIRDSIFDDTKMRYGNKGSAASQKTTPQQAPEMATPQDPVKKRRHPGPTDISKGNGSEQAPLRIGYMATMAHAPLFVWQESQWRVDADLHTELHKYTNSTYLVEDLIAGHLDIGYLDMGPIVATLGDVLTKNIGNRFAGNLEVIAASSIESVGLYVSGELAQYVNPDDLKNTIQRFVQVSGRRVRIGLLPRKHSSSVATRLWLSKQVGLGREDLRLRSASLLRLWAGLLQGRLDAAVVPEPLLTDMLQQDPGAKMTVPGSVIMPGMPTGAVVLNINAASRNRAAIQKLVDLQVRAVDYLNNSPSKAVPALVPYVGHQRLGAGPLQVALSSQALRYIADPARLVAGSRILATYMKQIGRFPDLPAMIDGVNIHFYEDSMAK